MFWVQLIIAGVATGSIYALSGMGLVLTYKATGIFNFAYGAIAMLVAYVLYQMNQVWHIPLLIALPIAVIGVGPAIGLALERGARVFRVHDVAEARDGLTVAAATLRTARKEAPA